MKLTSTPVFGMAFKEKEYSNRITRIFHKTEKVKRHYITVPILANPTPPGALNWLLAPRRKADVTGLHDIIKNDLVNVEIAIQKLIEKTNNSWRARRAFNTIQRRLNNIVYNFLKANSLDEALKSSQRLPQIKYSQEILTKMIHGKDIDQVIEASMYTIYSIYNTAVILGFPHSATQQLESDIKQIKEALEAPIKKYITNKR